MTKENDVKETLVVAPKLTESDSIWTEVKDLPIAMFALPSQTVKQHVQRVQASPEALYLVLNSPAVIASLEAALADSRNGKKYTMDLADGGYVIIKHAPPSVTLTKVISKN
jgi:hypothetical protein